jgi:hypothetical protein
MPVKNATRAPRKASSRSKDRVARPAAPARLPDWGDIEEELVEKIRASGRLTEADLAFRINSKG